MGGIEEQTDLIKSFVEVSSKARGLLDQRKVDEAKQVYLELLSVYNEINNSALVKYHKEIAHSELIKLHTEIEHSKPPIKLPHIKINVLIAVVLVIVLSIFMIQNPKIIGLVSLSDTLTHSMNTTITESGIIEVNLHERPLSLGVTGTFTGKAKLYLKQGETLRLIFDSETNEGDTFTNVCGETCSVKTDSNAIVLFVTLGEESTLYLDSINYKVERKQNTAPKWTGKTKEFTLTDGQGKLDLNNYFSDADGDKLTYLATMDEGLNILVQDNKLTIKSTGSKGKKSITLIATDLEEVIKVPVTVNVV